MKRSAALVLGSVLLLCFALMMVSCGGTEETTVLETTVLETTVLETTTSTTELSVTPWTGTTIPGVARVGFLTWVASTPEKDEEFAMASQGHTEDVSYFDTLDDLIMAVRTGEIERGITAQCAVEWVTGSDSTLASTVNPNQTITQIAMAVSENAEELLADLNEAIDAMKADGTLDSLVAEYIKGVAPGEIPPAVAIPSVAGGTTIRAAVTGNLPPLDCFDESGEPVGFSTALLAEISKRLGVNVEFVKVGVEERGTAITGGDADVALWVRGYDKGEVKPPVFIPDQVAGTLISTPYHSEAEYLIHLPGYTMPAEE